MKPIASLESSNPLGPSLHVRPKSTDSACDSDSNSYFDLCHENEDLCRSKGAIYQKPKKMWIAKEQAQSNLELTPSISSLVSTQLSYSPNHCRITDEATTSPSSSSAMGTVPLLSSSSTNTSSISNHTPLASGHGSSCILGDSISSCASPASIQLTNSKRRKRSKQRSNVSDIGTPVQKRGLKKIKSQESLPTCSPANISDLESNSSSSGINGLKIRIRRDVITQPGKRGKSKSDVSFRIVESWCDGDENISLNSRPASSPSSSLTGSGGGIQVGDIVWAKLAGYPYWPSRISSICARTHQQLTLATPLPGNNEPDSLAVLATPTDPNLAGGYTAKIDWLAGSQCSYLSCAKLYPFLEYYDRMYNPRTRIKGYADAIRIANDLVNNKCSDFPLHVDTPSVSLISPKLSHADSLIVVTSQAPVEEALDLSTSVPINSLSELNPIDTRPYHFDYFKDSDETALPCLSGDLFGETLGLPQLDVSDFATNVIPSFSEDEDDDDLVAKHLQMAL